MSDNRFTVLIIVLFVIVIYLVCIIPSATNEAYTSTPTRVADITLGDLWNGTFSIDKSMATQMAKNIVNAVYGETESEGNMKEGFLGSYYYPADYPYYWPFYYSSCVERMFGDIVCLPLAAHPFW
jgi:hypothetical protein